MSVVYCSADDILDRLSASGVKLRNDDRPPHRHGNALARASRIVDRFCLRVYSQATLQANEWVQFVTADIATYLLCARRGNPVPGSVAEFYQMAMTDLKDIYKGRADIPGAAKRRTSAPVMSNVTSRLIPNPHTRVVKARSTTTGGTPTDYQQVQDFSEITEKPFLDYPQG